MRITKVKNLDQNAIFWRRAHPRKCVRMGDEYFSPEDNPTESRPIAEIWDELILVDPNFCDFCSADLSSYPPLPECPECHKVNVDRECFQQVREIVSWWSNNPEPPV